MTQSNKLDKLLQGVTALELHAQLAWGGKSCICGGKPVVRIRMLGQLSEMVKRVKEDLVPLLSAAIVRTKFGAFVVVSEVTACHLHRRELEKQAAKAPSWMLAEIDRGPKETTQIAVKA